MPPNFPESDWKTLSHLKPLALDRLCARILQESSRIITGADEGEHHRAYLDLYRHIHTSDKTLGDCFDAWSRSRGLLLLMKWRAENLLTEEEFAAFSAGTRDMVDDWLKQ